MTVRAVLVVAALLLTTPGSADAGWRINRSLAIAQTVWHPTCGQLQLGYGDPERVGLPIGVGEWAWKGDCTIRIPNGSHYEFEELCTVILHGAGHVAGMGHSTNPDSVMYPEHLVIKTTAKIGHRTVVRWTGVDHRCQHRGRAFLERHGLLARRAAPAPRASGS